MQPYSETSENAVVGTLLMHPQETMDKLREKGLQVESFYNRQNQIMFEAIMDMDAKAVDSLIIAQKLKDTGVIEQCGGFDRLGLIQDSAVMPEIINSHIDLIMEKHRSRQTIFYCESVIESISKGESPDLLGMRHITDIEGIAPPVIRAMTDKVDSAWESFNAVASGKVVSLPFPWREFQNKTLGLPLGSVVPLLGRDKTGKSRLCMQLVIEWIMDGTPVLVFAFEDGEDRYLSNLAATLGRYDGFTARRNPSPKYMETAEDCHMYLKKLPLYVIEDSMTAEEMVATIASHKRKYGIQGVVVDGFKDIISTKGENRTQEENHIFETVKRGAKRSNVGVVQIEHTHDVEDGKWLSRRNIKGSKQRGQSARMFLIYQDCGFNPDLMAKYGIQDNKQHAVLECPVASYGNPAGVVLKIALEQGQFIEAQQIED